MEGGPKRCSEPAAVGLWGDMTELKSGYAVTDDP